MSMLPIHTCGNVTLSLHLGATRPRQGNVQIVPRLSDGRPMPISSRARSDRGQMDGADYPVAVEKDNALRGAPARDRGGFAKDADANPAQPRARRPCRT